jgi:transcriptional regulator with XRE-family HTH domain
MKRRAPEEETEAIVARNLRAARIAAGMTQAQLAEAIGVTNESLSRAERGTILPTVRTLARAATVLGTSIDALAGRVPVASKSAPSSGDARRIRLQRLVAVLDDRAVRRLLGLVELLPRERPR